MAWIFGYGSLIWRPNFEYKEKMVGHVKGFCRRFWQESVINRGTKEKPGRVAALMESDSESKVWGVALYVSDTDKEEVLNKLITRELCHPTKTVFFPKDQSKETVEVEIFNCGEGIAQFTGREDIKTTAQFIAQGVGTTGMKNDEYVTKVLDFTHNVAGVEDTYLIELDKLVKEYQKNMKS
ncbi:putative glutathione-specific gamma-glutamylcyclotransferase 2 [Saccoglossus kowalevskii]|uniref:Cation transport regulator-like protein 2-like n=1 Tax=Saccoglossus kowalevskii TaxID=10224 RepID=A0ABM0GRI2_SACKO|nr:PREDICTED: cation transport regulator-like protein 2-like [Saccoglossus kowalevskii]